MGRPDAVVLRSHLGSVLLAESERPRGRSRQPASTAPSWSKPSGRRAAGRFTAHYRIPSVEHVATMAVAGTPPQLLAYYQALVGSGMRYFIVSYGRDEETLRLLAWDVVPHVGTAA